MAPDQVPGNGEFLLYPNIRPMLPAGHYVLGATQKLSANGRAEASLPVDTMNVHIDVRSPRLVLPPDQVLSTFPPAESEGAYAARLPQVVIRRRTLPWERRVVGAPETAPWMALVVVAEGEATLVPNVTAADAVTPGVTLPGAIDADVANCLEIRQSMVNKIFPTRKDVPLLAHARHVDINDTELMMGDDDGFLAVVVANRLPVSACDDTGAEAPMKYTACLVNLEGQWNRLLPSAPAPRLVSIRAGIDVRVSMSTAAMDKHAMGGKTNVPVGSPTRADSRRETRFRPDEQLGVADSAQHTMFTGFSKAAATPATKRTGAVGAFAAENLRPEVIGAALDPMLRFPVLLHWRFTTSGSTTFQRLMEGLDSGLLGTVKAGLPEDVGRPPLELVDTGHVGIAQRTRRGDSVRAWYRGPFVPHPTDDSERLELAHASDQLRIVIPDGREDLSLASAFEMGRLLALANPNMVAALLRWRQLHFATVRRTQVWGANAAVLGALDGFVLSGRVTARAATDLSRAIMRAVTDAPTEFLGPPRALADAGRPLPFEGEAGTLLSRGLGLPTFRGEPAAVLKTIQKAPIRIAPVTEQVGRVPGEGFAELDRMLLDRTLGVRVERLATDSVVRFRGATDEAKRGRGKRGAAAKRERGGARRDERDALDEIIARLSRGESTEDSE